MAIDYDRLKAWSFAPVEQTYSTRDVMLYALGIGIGENPLDAGQLDFVYEKRLKVLPTMAAVLGSPGFWQRSPGTGLDALRLVHGEQSVTWHRPLPIAATIRAQTRITAIVDKGKDKGALVAVERAVFDKATGDALATVQAVTFCRADGGFGDRGDVLPAPHRVPAREPDVEVALQTVPQAALIYRLSGDDNPLHADPEVAQQAGFAKPILHGLATYGIAGYAIIKAFGNYRPESLRSLRARFSAPVYPGERIRTQMWRDGNVISFRSYADERGVMVLDAGRAEID
jgi:acyl dehydratase